MSIFKNFFQANTVRAFDDVGAHKQELLRREINATKEIFGPIKDGVVRDFFCIDQHTWVWYEEWIDNTGQRKRMTTRFDVRDGGVSKSQNGGDHRPLGEIELQNFKTSIATYVATVKKSVYSEITLN